MVLADSSVERATAVHGPMCHEYGIRGYGNPEEGVVVVGIAPGRDEAEKTKRPFTGPSGRLLDQLLAFADWDRARVYCTNVICWWNNAPTEAERDECRPRLVRELTDLKPKLIIAAGNIASEALLGTKRRPGQRGAVLWSDYWNAYVLDTHHPSFALQSESMSAVQDIIRDLSKIPLVLEWPPRAEHTLVTYDLVSDLQSAQHALRALPRDRPVTLDIETSNPDDENIDAYSDQLLCWSVSYVLDSGRKHTIVFGTSCVPLCIRDGSHVRSYRETGRCGACGLGETPLEWPMDVQWTFQAGQYDIGALAVYFGIVLPLWGDTMLMSVCNDERPGNHRLKNNAREWLGAGFYNVEVKKFYKGKLNKLDPAKLYEYNAKDSRYTLDLMPIFERGMDECDTRRLYDGVLLPAMQTFISMQVRGINVDQKVLQELAYDNWFPRSVETHHALQEEAYDLGWPTRDLNFNSAPQMQKFFFQILGVEPIKFSQKTGRPSLDKETLDQIDHPFAAKLRAFRTLDTMIDYVLAVYANLKWDGKLHPSAFVSTTRTGRTSYRNPAVQTIPKDYTVGEDYARLRETIIPHNPDTHEIGEYDFNQIEVWLAWAESRDPVLLEHLQSGDVHSATAEGAFNTKRELWTPLEWAEKRQNAKKIRFGIQFGEGAEKLSTPPPVGIGGSVAQCRLFINNFKKTYSVYTAWMDAVQREALNKGYLVSPSGRVMRFPLVMDHKQLRQAINFPIQSTASDYNLLSMVDLAHPDLESHEFARRLRDLNSYVILNVHDCLVIEQDRRHRNEVVALIREVMERPRFPGYPSIKVDCKIGDSLGTVRKFDTKKAN